MIKESLDSQLIIPTVLSEDDRPAGVFVFLSDQMPYHYKLRHISRHIESMAQSYKRYLQKVLDLQMSDTILDSQGKVCFANDPDLRPGFRTTFHPMELWDYYYAWWHSRTYWNHLEDPDSTLPLPVSDQFWKMVEFGSELRKLHGQRKKLGNPGIDFIKSKDFNTGQSSTRFTLSDEMQQTGHLTVNAKYHINNVPEPVWAYTINGFRPVLNWIEKHTCENLEDAQKTAFIQMLLAVDETQRIQRKIDQYLTKNQT